MFSMQFQYKYYNYGNSKNLICKILMLFFLASFQSIVYGQSAKKVKTKITKQKDTIAKSKISVSKTNKTLVLDSLKIPKNPLETSDVALDSLFIVPGNFKLFKKSAHASYYANQFHGRKTASGKKYDMNKLTAAHKKLPFGTKVRVTNEANLKSVIVEITDRGPFVRSRDIDLSKKAFMEITNSKTSGKMTVTLEVLQK